MTGITDTAALPAKNHNNPPSDVEILGEQITIRHVQIIRAAESHLDIVSRVPDHFTQENEAEYITGHINLMQNCIKELERRRQEEKEPFLRQGQYVDMFFGDIKEKLKSAIDRCSKPLGDWLQRKADREREEREADAKLLREQQEAVLRAAAGGTATVEQAVEAVQQTRIAESLAAQPLITLAKTTGVHGSSSKMAEKWVGAITDIDQLDVLKLRPYLSAKALQEALDRFIKQGGRQCDGAKIEKITAVKVK